MSAGGENKGEEKIGERLLDEVYGAEGGGEAGGLGPSVARPQGLSLTEREDPDPRRGLAPEEVGALERAGRIFRPSDLWS